MNSIIDQVVLEIRYLLGADTTAAWLLIGAVLLALLYVITERS